MKIAILTLPLYANYGGILQAYALQCVLQSRGHNVEHLQPELVEDSLHPFWLMPLVWCKRIIRKFFRGEKELPIFRNPHIWIRENIITFLNNRLIIRYLNNNDWIQFESDKYDVLIIGSDQVWRPKYAYPLGRYFADFCSDRIKKIAYAASFGVESNEYSKEQQNKCAVLLKKFESVSVRESSGIELCAKLFGVQAIDLIDPTMLLDKNDYLNLLYGETTLSKEGELMVYLLDTDVNVESLVSSVSNALGMIPFYTNSKIEDSEATIIEKYCPKVEQWIKGFEDAKFVLTDSFHACVFSIIFKKDFIVYTNESRGISRIKSLLEKFGMLDRIVSGLDDFRDRESVLLSPINFSIIDSILEIEKAKSDAFLKQCGL